MPKLASLSVQYTGQDMSPLIRELNDRLRRIELALNQNFEESVDISGSIDGNVNAPVMLARVPLQIDGWSLYPTSVATTPTVILKLNGVTKDTQSPSVVQTYDYEISTPVAVAAGDLISLDVSSLTASAFVAYSLDIRRL